MIPSHPKFEKQWSNVPKWVQYRLCRKIPDSRLTPLSDTRGLTELVTVGKDRSRRVNWGATKSEVLFLILPACWEDLVAFLQTRYKDMNQMIPVCRSGAMMFEWVCLEILSLPKLQLIIWQMKKLTKTPLSLFFKVNGSSLVSHTACVTVYQVGMHPSTAFTSQT